MMRSLTVRTLSFVAVTVAIPATLAGCPKKAPPVEDAGTPPPPASTPEVTELAPMVDEAGADAGAEGGKKWGGGPGYNSNQLKIKACCNGIRTQAKAMGNGPEAFQMNSVAAMCDGLVAQVGPAGNAPEFNQLRQMLQSVKLPSACQF